MLGLVPGGSSQGTTWHQSLPGSQRHPAGLGLLVAEGSQPVPHPVIRESLASGRRADTQAGACSEGKTVWSSGEGCGGAEPLFVLLPLGSQMSLARPAGGWMPWLLGREGTDAVFSEQVSSQGQQLS